MARPQVSYWRRARRGSKASVPPRELHRLGHLPALEHGGEDPVGGRPGAHADGGAGLGQLLGDREPEAPVVGYTGDERALAREIDR
jgi:hypothetical protein